MTRPLDDELAGGYVRFSLRHLGHGDAPDDPPVDVEFLMDGAVGGRPVAEAAVGARRPPARGQPAVDGRDHVADHVRFHASALCEDGSCGTGRVDADDPLRSKSMASVSGFKCTTPARFPERPVP
jgi:hypothetical protein